MSYRIPTLVESAELLIAAFRAQFPERNVGAKRTYHRRRIDVLAMALTELHAHIQSAQDDLMPDTATGTFAERWGTLVGTDRKSATPARKSDALRVTGDLAATVSEGDTLVHEASGLRFAIAQDGVIPAELFLDVDIVAIDTGSRTRLDAGEVLVFDETPAGINSRAELQLDIDEDGFDIEQESAFKRRYLDAMGEPTAGGNDADYIRWQEALDGVEQAFVYPNRAGRGTVDIVSLHAGSSDERALSEAEAEVVVAALAELAPSQVSATGGSLRHLTVIPDEQDIELVVEPNGAAEWAFDWNDSTPPEVDTWDSGTRILTFADDRPASMKAGDRLCVHGVASSQTGEVLVIESLISTDGVKLETAPEVDPEPTDIVYAGGPLTAIIRDALLAHVGGDIVYAGDDGPIPAAVAEEENANVFALKVLAEGIGPANPDGAYGTWSGGLICTVLEGLANFCRGVRKSTCIIPASDYEAEDYAFPDDLQIGLVVPGEVLVRKAW